MRVAVVGAGPRGLWATERLLEASGSDALAIDVYDDRTPGEGAGYATDQPDAWRLNVRSDLVETGLGTFDDWRMAQGEEVPLDPFPPRSLVGRYLADAWARVDADARVSHIGRRVLAIDPSGDGWSVDGKDYDEVLLVTGHADGPRPALDEEAIPLASSVAVRGAALTFIDVALALTEGRGGEWVQLDKPPAYLESGREPWVIYPTSRSGRFMEVKPEPRGLLGKLQLDERWGGTRGRIAEASDLDALIAALADGARVALEVARARTTDGVDAVLAGEDFTGDPVAELLASWEVATGRRHPGPAWAVGAAWRGLYPAVVDRVSFGGAESLPGFWELARRMERVAFGPPAVNAGKLLGLIDAGMVDASYLRDTDAAVAAADHYVDAVIASPGVHEGTLVGDLVARGIGRVGEHGALVIERDGTIAGVQHLAAAGRVTEGITLGNDTLSRALHPQLDLWAQRVAAAADREGAAGPDVSSVQSEGDGG